MKKSCQLRIPAKWCISTANSGSTVSTFIVTYNISQPKGFVNWVSRRYSLIRQLAASLADGGQGREGVGVFVGTRLTVGLTSGLGVGVDVGINVV